MLIRIILMAMGSFAIMNKCKCLEVYEDISFIERHRYTNFRVYDGSNN